jgi:hypothetical protein
VTKKSKAESKSLLAWMRRNPRTRIPLAASSLAMTICLSTWLVLIIVFASLGRREDLVAVSQVLQLPFLTLLFSTVVLSMRIGKLRVQVGKWFRIVVRDLAKKDLFPSSPSRKLERPELKKGNRSTL